MNHLIKHALNPMDSTGLDWTMEAGCVIETFRRCVETMKF